MADLPRVLQELRAGVTNPKGTFVKDFSGDSHTWLTFVTESGKIFDLDLSSLQFGMDSDLPFPCLLPVLGSDAKALVGLSTRDEISKPGQMEFAQTIRNLNDEVVRNSGTKDSSDFVSKLMENAPKEMPKFADPEYFWRVI